jgi:hypothetical protein
MAPNRKSAQWAVRGMTFGLVVLALGCTRATKSATLAKLEANPPPVEKERPQEASTGTLLVDSMETLKPETNPGPGATLRLGAPQKKGTPPPTEFDVDLVQIQKGDEISITLRTQGETIEREVYQDGEKSFRILSTSDDTFAPGIDLLRFPVKEGDAWDWKGKVLYAGISRPATAEISAAKDHEDIRIDVELGIKLDEGRLVRERRLQFWFRKGKGLIARSFGEVSARRLRSESWPP